MLLVFAAGPLADLNGQWRANKAIPVFSSCRLCLLFCLSGFTFILHHLRCERCRRFCPGNPCAGDDQAGPVLTRACFFAIMRGQAHFCGLPLKLEFYLLSRLTTTSFPHLVRLLFSRLPPLDKKAWNGFRQSARRKCPYGNPFGCRALLSGRGRYRKIGVCPLILRIWRLKINSKR